MALIDELKKLVEKYDGGSAIAQWTTSKKITVRMCMRCALKVDELGQPDPEWYSPEWISAYHRSTEKKCAHTKG